MSSEVTEASDFSVLALYAALDAKRAELGLSWHGVAKAIWDESRVLNAQRNDHPISISTITSMAKRGDTTCQHALFMLRWLGREPESFVPGQITTEQTRLPITGEDKRLRWNLKKTYEALEAKRRREGLTWRELAKVLRCTPSQISGIKRARFAISMVLAMRIVHWLECSARDFIYVASY